MTAREYRLMPMSAFGVKADMAFAAQMSAYDPKRTSSRKMTPPDIIRWCSSGIRTLNFFEHTNSRIFAVFKNRAALKEKSRGTQGLPVGLRL